MRSHWELAHRKHKGLAELALFRDVAAPLSSWDGNRHHLHATINFFMAAQSGCLFAFISSVTSPMLKFVAMTETSNTLGPFIAARVFQLPHGRCSAGLRGLVLHTLTVPGQD